MSTSLCQPEGASTVIFTLLYDPDHSCLSAKPAAFIIIANASAFVACSNGRKFLLSFEMILLSTAISITGQTHVFSGSCLVSEK